ncbi:YhaN family protein [Sphingomonas sp.]|jgi:uncharacterized protein YhaN|uniref:YhaN family protein n=1 Tax=Sphingomonas sp. TaxID=28214 RepID=UPI00262E07F6|nr:YhaN family protein [Sphingomonas sp.]MDF2605663.1 hypothetical protein [Sphingomonas sp.]
MRFRQIELIRYGGFADRLLDFGEGAGEGDLHLIVGPNEAGKSTTLHAIGDFLFGIAGQTAQGWRFGYGDLRIRGLIEAEGRTIEAVRRKGNKDTLLHPATGAALPGDVLAPLLAGVDRTAFERMFGLDHQRLRDGGEAILRGRDDAAQITLEAGTGIAGIGQVLDALSGEAAELFKPSASKPVVNKLMAERAEALKRVREASIGERDWGEEKQRRAAAEERRAALLAENDALTREETRLDRIRRARAPLSRRASAEAALAALGPMPDLPADAGDALARARGDRRTAEALEMQLQGDLDRVAQAIGGIAVAGDVLALDTRIAALEERRPVIEKAAGDLHRRLARREEIDARLASARAEAGLAPDAPLPGAVWRRRAAAYLQERREAAAAASEAAKRRADLSRRVAALTRDLAGQPAPVDTARLEAALATLPTDAAGEQKRAAADVARRAARAAEQIALLAPWQGPAEALAAMALPAPSTVAAIAHRIAEARDQAVQARRESDAQEGERIRAEGRIAALAAGEELPTGEAIQAARAARDALVADLLAGKGVAAEAIRAAVTQADALADRRNAQAARMADHAAAVAARDLAVALRDAALARIARAEQDRAAQEAEWAALLAPLGFAVPVPAADWPAWVERRAQALTARREADEAGEALAALEAQARAAADAVVAALRAIGAEPPADPAMLATSAQARVREAIAAASARAELEKALARATAELAAAERDDAAPASDADAQSDAGAVQGAGRDGGRLGDLLREAGLLRAGLMPEDQPPAAGVEALADALAAIEGVAEELTSRADVERQIAAMNEDSRRFAEETAAVLAVLGRSSAEPATRIVAALAAEWRRAEGARERLAGLTAERDRLSSEKDKAAAQRLAAARLIDGLRERIGADDEAALDSAVATAGERARLIATIREAEAELAGLAGPDGLDALAAEVAALSPEEEAIAQASLTERRADVAAAREEVGRALAEAEAAFARAAQDSSAADAQQIVADSAAAMGAAAEAHVEAAAAAALLRWVLDRHRQQNQAPLIDRAGTLFATVTAGAFAGLGVDYDDQDRPAIRAIRAGGAAVGVEALSEGTRDQLYLALRLGAIETGQHALPIVCDDLLITADDDRAAAMLRVLAVAARRNQVLLFTHHAHLIDVARSALGEGGFRLHRLEPAALAAA